MGDGAGLEPAAMGDGAGCGLETPVAVGDAAVTEALELSVVPPRSCILGVILAGAVALASSRRRAVTLERQSCEE